MAEKIRSYQKHDTRGAQSTGNRAEKRFEKVCENCGLIAIKSHEAVDKYSHIDYLVYEKGTGVQYTVDVKAMPLKKSLQRYRTIEIKGVGENGFDNPGWLNGKAKYIAFEFLDGFALVDREQLKEYVMRNVNQNIQEDRIENAWHRFYTRPGRNDLITLLNNEEVIALAVAHLYE